MLKCKFAFSEMETNAMVNFDLCECMCPGMESWVGRSPQLSPESVASANLFFFLHIGGIRLGG